MGPCGWVTHNQYIITAPVRTTASGSWWGWGLTTIMADGIRRLPEKVLDDSRCIKTLFVLKFSCSHLKEAGPTRRLGLVVCRTDRMVTLASHIYFNNVKLVWCGVFSTSSSLFCFSSSSLVYRCLKFCNVKSGGVKFEGWFVKVQVSYYY